MSKKRVHSLRKRIPARTVWGDVVGYSRAVRTGGIIAVSGTAPSDEHGSVVGKDDAYAQTVFVIKKIEKALNDLGARLDDVVRTRIYTTDIGRWKQIAKAHQEFFGTIKPANTMVQVNRLIDPDMLVEIEMDAIVEQ